MIETCSSCGVSLGTHQLDIFDAPKKCITCQTNDRIMMILNTLPHEGDFEFERLNRWEQTFLPSVRRQFTKKRTLTDLQYENLERLWTKMNS